MGKGKANSSAFQIFMLLFFAGEKQDQLVNKISCSYLTLIAKMKHVTIKTQVML